MKTSEQGIKLIKHFESLRLEAYQCAANTWTIGYGHTRTARQGLVITEREADKLLEVDMAIFEAQINKLRLKVNQNQYDALVSFTFNLGFGNFKNSTLLKKIRMDADDFKIASEFIRWTKANGKRLRGLLLRRLAESVLYFSK